MYPHKQRPLEKPDGLDVSDQSKEHPQVRSSSPSLLNAWDWKELVWQFKGEFNPSGANCRSLVLPTLATATVAAASGEPWIFLTC